METIFYRPIMVNEFGRKGTNLYAAQATTTVFRPHTGLPEMEINMKGDSVENAKEKLQKMLDQMDNEDVIMFELDLELIGAKEYTDEKGRCIYTFDHWYVQHDGTAVHKSSTATFENGMDIESLIDDDMFSTMKKINSLESLVMAVEL